MTIEEAMERYSIPIPEDIYNYDKEKYRQFDNIFLKSFYNTFYTDEINEIRNDRKEQKVAVVLGGQTGAGKSSLVADTKRKFKDEGRRIVLIDDDQYRKLYPYGKEILENCPEYYTKITATATSKVTPKILKFASENGYNFIFDGTMKNERILNTMESWKDYEIQIKIMATSRLRSLSSIAIRNGELRKLGEEGRYISCYAHDETYFGIPETLRRLETRELANQIEIYTRGINPLFPKREYSSLDEKRISSADRLEELRKLDEEKFLETAKEDIKYLESLSINLSLEEQEESNKIVKMIKEEMKNNEKNINDDNYGR